MLLRHHILPITCEISSSSLSYLSAQEQKGGKALPLLQRTKNGFLQSRIFNVFIKKMKCSLILHGNRMI